MACFRRFLTILTGWVIASLIACYLAPLLLITAIIFTDPSAQENSSLWTFFLFAAYVAPFVAIIFIPLNFIPSVVFIFWAERKVLRYWYIYALAGLVIGAGSTTFIVLWNAMDDFRNYVLMISTGAVSGFAAGLIYWWIAVRSHRFKAV